MENIFKVNNKDTKSTVSELEHGSRDAGVGLLMLQPIVHLIFEIQVLLEFHFPSVSAERFHETERATELCHIPAVIPSVKSTVTLNRVHL